MSRDTSAECPESASSMSCIVVEKPALLGASEGIRPSGMGADDGAIATVVRRRSVRRLAAWLAMVAAVIACIVCAGALSQAFAVSAPADPVEADPTQVAEVEAVAAEQGVRILLLDGQVAFAPNVEAATAVRAALTMDGAPYQWGGTDPSGFDCSGFTRWAYRHAGVELPRLAQDQGAIGAPVAQRDLLPGDLAVWTGHVALYVGAGKLIEAGGDPVGVIPLRTEIDGQDFLGFYRPTAGLDRR